MWSLVNNIDFITHTSIDILVTLSILISGHAVKYDSQSQHHHTQNTIRGQSIQTKQNSANQFLKFWFYSCERRSSIIYNVWCQSVTNSVLANMQIHLSPFRCQLFHSFIVDLIPSLYISCVYMYCKLV